MNERIKQARRALGLTQQAFAERIGMRQNSIALVESGKRNISDQALLSICREFRINETWLRTGDGEMFLPESRNSEIERFIGLALVDEQNEFKKNLLHVLSRLSDDQWTLLADIAEKLAEEQKKD